MFCYKKYAKHFGRWHDFTKLFAFLPLPSFLAAHIFHISFDVQLLIAKPQTLRQQSRRFMAKTSQKCSAIWLHIIHYFFPSLFQFYYFFFLLTQHKNKIVHKLFCWNDHFLFPRENDDSSTTKEKKTIEFHKQSAFSLEINVARNRFFRLFEFRIATYFYTGESLSTFQMSWFTMVFRFLSFVNIFPGKHLWRNRR